jgi:hypothetical protein
MIPGFAKSREDLPYLPYRTSDKVYVINSHNFGGGAFSPAVNGKMPIAAWIPSRDDAGNGTTTLTDLVGSNDGTLTNMDPATDWVADTDAGGVRALDFDGVNDTTVHDRLILPSNVFSISTWVKPVSVSGVRMLVAQYGSTTFDRGWYLAVISGAVRFLVSPNGGLIPWGQGGTVSTGSWQHIVSVSTGSAFKIYIDGNPVTTSLTGTYPSTIFNSSVDFQIGARHGTDSPYSGLQDDARVFDQALDATDVADLYAAGRGGDAS